jgi:hypothetical protein
MGSMASIQTGACSVTGLDLELSWAPEICRRDQVFERIVGTPGVGVHLDYQSLVSTGRIPPGTYPIGAFAHETELYRLSSSAILWRIVAECQPEERYGGTGTLTISSFTDRHVSGGVDLLFPDGTTVYGTFDADLCSSVGGACDDLNGFRMSQPRICRPPLAGP